MSESPLHIACERGHLRLTKKLLDAGASMTLRNQVFINFLVSGIQMNESMGFFDRMV